MSTPSKFDDTKNALLLAFSFITIASLVSRSVMVKVDKNDGKDCPDVSGPAIATFFYGLTMLFMAYFAFFKRNNPYYNMTHIIGFSAIAILCLAIFIAYIPFAIKSQNKKSSDRECLSDVNKKAIEYMELILMGVLSLTSFFVIFTVKSS
jgi:hypothetical protein